MIGGAHAEVDRRAHRREEVGLSLAAQLHMGVAEVERVLGEERRNDLVLDIALQLVGPDELGVHHDGEPVPAQVVGGGELVGGQRDVDGGVAVGVDVQRQAEVVDLFEPAVDDVLGEAEFTTPVVLAVRSVDQIRRGEVRGAALR